MIEKIFFIVNEKEILLAVKEIRSYLDNRDIKTDLWDRTTPEGKQGAGGGPTVGGILTIGLTVVLTQITEGALTEAGKDIYIKLKEIGRRLIDKIKSIQKEEKLLLTIEIGETPDYWYNFYFYTDDLNEILKAVTKIPQMIYIFHSMKDSIETSRTSFKWRKGCSKWAL